CRLITLAHRNTRVWEAGATHRLSDDPVKPSLTPEQLAAHAEGLIALTGCHEGEIARLVDRDRLEEAERVLERLKAVFGDDNVFVELQHNLVQGDTQRNAKLMEVARRAGSNVVATGNVHYHVRSRHRLQDAMVAIKNRATLESSHRL